MEALLFPLVAKLLAAGGERLDGSDTGTTNKAASPAAGSGGDSGSFPAHVFRL